MATFPLTPRLHSTSLTALILIVVLARFASSIPISPTPILIPRSAPPPRTQHVRGQNGTLICGFDGDEDMYGLGIRLGYYIQWVATVFGAYYTPKVVSSAFEANTIFNIGMLAGLVYSTVARKDMDMNEPLIVLGFSVGGAIVGLLDPKNVHNPKSIRSLRARMVHLCGTALLYFPLLVYWIWYSFMGMDRMSRVSECPAWTFMLYKVDARSPWFADIMKSGTVISIVGLGGLGAMCTYVYRVKSLECDPVQEDNGLGGRKPRLGRTATALAIRARPTKLQFVVVIVANSICALSVELSIVWNHIGGVNKLGATGQLIPIAIGLLTSIRVFVGIVNRRIRKLKKREKEKREKIKKDGDPAVPMFELHIGEREDADWGDEEDWHGDGTDPQGPGGPGCRQRKKSIAGRSEKKGGGDNGKGRRRPSHAGTTRSTGRSSGLGERRGSTFSGDRRGSTFSGDRRGSTFSGERRGSTFSGERRSGEHRSGERRGSTFSFGRRGSAFTFSEKEAKAIEEALGDTESQHEESTSRFSRFLRPDDASGDRRSGSLARRRSHASPSPRRVRSMCSS